MLIEKKDNLVAGNVISFRTTHGDEIVAKLVSEDDTTIVVTKPIIAQVQMVSQNQAGIVFAPFMSTVNEDTAKFSFAKAHLVATPLLTRADVSANYIKMTTGLDIAPAGILKA